MQLSIIIPAWNEAGKIAGDIREISLYIKNVNPSTELIIVDDGSSDNTAEIAENAADYDSFDIKVIRYSPHRGKGCAVRKGILEFITSGLKLIKQRSCDILIGSRYLPESVIKKKLIWYRRLISYIFRQNVKRYFHLPEFVTDTQCGFKFFKGDIARELFGKSGSDGFIFDLEIILLALEKKYKICEFPIEWRCDRDSRLSLVRSFIPILRDLRKLKQHF